MPEVSSPDWLTLTFWTRDPESVRNLFLILGGFLAGLSGLGLLWWRTWNIHRQTNTLMRRHEAQVEADRERRITDNFTRAVELLGSDKLETRLGAVYALERIARESQEDHWPIMETLTAYIRERAPSRQATRSLVRLTVENGEEQKETEQPPIDVQACLTVIGRRCREYDRGDERLNLSNTDLRYARLQEAHLEGAILAYAHLECACFIRTHLENAWLIEAHLEEANLRGAYLEKASFDQAHLEGADLRRTDITQEQFDSAYTDENTKVPPHIKRPAKPVGEVAEAELAPQP